VKILDSIGFPCKYEVLDFQVFIGVFEMKNSIEKTVPSQFTECLADILRKRDISATGLSWDNISVVGDLNIQYIIDKIQTSDQLLVSCIKQRGEDDRLSASEQKDFNQKVDEFFYEFTARTAVIVRQLNALKTGIVKPLLPFFREPTTYMRKHLIIFSCGDSPVKAKWRSMITDSSSNSCGNERYHLTAFKRLIDRKTGSGKENLSACGYYWQVEMYSCTVMLYEDLLFFKNYPEESFMELWFLNSHCREFSSTTEFKLILAQQITSSVVSDFSASVLKLVKFLKNGRNFPSDKAWEMERLGHTIEHDFQ
jgi:hypothetical protein